MPNPSSRTRRRCRIRQTGIWTIVTGGLLVLAAWSAWPGVRFAHQVLPGGSSACGTVPMLNAWTIWWNADRLAHGLDGYWDAPIFYPARGTFAYSEPQPATWIVAPLVWWAESPVLAYHVYLFMMLTLNGVFAVRLLRRCRTRWPIAVVGGVAMLLLPLVHLQNDVLQLMPLWGVLWTLESLLKLHRRPAWGPGIELGLACSMTFFTCVHHGLFLTLLLATTAWTMIPWRRWQPWLAAIGIAAATAAILLLPLLWPMRRILKQQDFRRRPATVESLSATSADWLRSPPNAVIPSGDQSLGSRHTLSPGWCRVALAMLGLAICWRRRYRRRITVFLAVLAGMAFIGSLGMNLHLYGWRPWETLGDWIPGILQVRSVYRFAYFVQLAIVLLAAMGLDSLSRSPRLHVPNKKLRATIQGALVVVIGGLLAFETPPTQVRWVEVPDVSVDHPWQTFLREHANPGQSVVCLPFADGYSLQELDVAASWMLQGTRHARPLVNGYSGFFPPPWFDLMETIRDKPFAEATLTKLADADVQFIVIQTDQMAAPLEIPDQAGPFELTRAFWDDSGVEIWRLDRSER